MNFSGIVATTAPDEIHRVADRLPHLPGVEVHARHAPSGRIVVVLESCDDGDYESAFRRLRAQPGVLAVDLVYHFVDREPGPAGSAGPAPVSGGANGQAS